MSGFTLTQDIESQTPKTLSGTIVKKSMLHWDTKIQQTSLVCVFFFVEKLEKDFQMKFHLLSQLIGQI